MSLRLSLSEGNRLLWDFPLDTSQWLEGEGELFKRESEGLEGDIDALCAICDFYSNKKRLKMVNHILTECRNQASFTDLLRVAVNPKYVSDLVNKAPGGGLVVKEGHEYRMSPTGLGSFLLLSLATRKLLNTLDSISSRNKSFEEAEV